MSVIIERRLNLRLLAYWEKKRALSAMPRMSDIHASDLHDFWQFCFLLRLDGKGSFSRVHVGNAVDWTWLEPRLAPFIEEVLAKKAPCLDEGEFPVAGNKIVKYRQCLMPLGSEHGVEAVLGGVRFRNF